MKPATFLAIACAALTVFARADAQPAAAQNPCAADVQRLCADVQPGGGRVIACLKQHISQVSDGCKRAAGVPVTADDNSAPASAPPPASDSAGSPGSAPATHSMGSVSAIATVPVGPGGSKIKFVQRNVVDAEHGNMRAETVYFPENWSVQSKLTWHYETPWNPVIVTLHAEDPASAEAYFVYPTVRKTYSQIPPGLRQYARGQDPGMAPLRPIPAMVMFIKQTRSNAPNLRWIGQQNLPDLASAYHVPDPSKQLHGIAVKIGYDYKGHPVEEAFFGLYFLDQGSNPGVNAGVIRQTIWGLEGLVSFRAPAGQLDRNMALFAVILKSDYVNPEWLKLKTQLVNQMTAVFQANLKRGYDQISAAHQMAQQTMAQEGEFDKNFQAQESKLRSPGFDDSWLRDSGGGGGGGSASRSASDHMSDLLRGVDTLNDPTTGGTKQLTNAGSNHFADGLGNYRTYDDPNMTPEQAGESGSWTRMTEAQ